MQYKREKHILLSAIPENARKLMTECRVMILGGAVTSIFSSAPVSDYDLYFRTEEHKARFERGIADLGATRPVHTECATSWAYQNSIYQVIHVYVGQWMEILPKFDFTICQGGYDFLTEEFILYPQFLHHLSQRRVVYTGGTEYPIASLYRLMKYQKKGFTVSGIEVIKLALQVAELDIRDWGELRKQLMGIDTLFLKELLDQHEAGKQYDLEEFITQMEDYLEGRWERL